MSANTPEGRITRTILLWLNALDGCTAHKVAAGPYNRGGEPDIDAVWNGRAVKLETKRPGTEHAITHAVTDLQRARLLDYARCGALAGVVTSIDDAAAVLGMRLDTKPERELTARVRSRMATLGLQQREANVGSSA